MTGDADLTNYDPIAEAFLSHAGRPESWNNLYDRPYTLSKLPPLRGKDVLDLGCSTGFYTEYALKKGARVTAVDASQKMIDRLAAKLKSPKLTLHCADIGQPLGFLKAASFDCIVASLVLDYIKDWDALLKELHRVLKAGDRLVITVSHPFASYLHIKPESYYDFKLVEDTWAVGSGNPFKTSYYVRPLNEMLRPLLASPFKIISIEEMLPDESLKETHPDIYQRLMERPGFLGIVLEKPVD